MTPGVGVRLLGRVAVLRDGVEVPSGGLLQRSLLALLAAEPGARVDAEGLVDALWGRARPKTPRDALAVQLTRLRTWLGSPELVVADGGGYRLAVVPDQVDLAAFLRGAALSLDPARTAGDALDEAERALAWWGGEPFAGCVDCARLRDARDLAGSRHERLLRRRVRGLVEVGRLADAADAVAPLRRAAPESDEELAALAMRALSDRPSEATAIYLHTVRAVREESGIDPGAALREAYRDVVGRRPPGPSPVRRPVAAGRDRVVASLVADLQADGRVVLVEGEAGIGKSVLLQAVTHDADLAGAHATAGTWDTADAPLAAWREALGADVPARSSGPEVHQRLTERAADGPLLIALDDLHHADSASVGVLRGLVRLGVPRGVVVVLASRPLAGTARGESIARALAGSAQVRRLRLGELDHAAVVDLTARALVGFAPDAVDRLAEHVWSRAGGHALSVASLVALLEGRPDEASARAAVEQLPAGLRPVLEHQIAALPEPSRRALEGLAVLRPISVPELAAVLERSASEVAVRLRPAIEAGLAVLTPPGLDTTASELPDIDVRHELTAQAAADAVPTTVSAYLHHARLTSLAPGAEPMLILRHTVGAAALLSPGRVADAHLDAGVASYRRRALSEARGLLDAASKDLSPARIPELTVFGGLTLAALGEHHDAGETLDRALDLLLGVDGDALVLDASDQELAVLAAIGDEPLGLVIEGDPQRLARLRRVAALALPPRHRLEVLAATLREEGTVVGRLTPGLLDEARRLADDVADGDPAGSARVLALEARTLVDAPVPARDRQRATAAALAAARAVGEDSLLVDALELHMSACLAAGDTEDARALRTELAREAHRWLRPRSRWLAEVVDGATLLAQGRTEDADDACRRALALGNEHGLPTARPTASLHRFVAQWFAGDLAPMATLVALAARTMPGTAAWTAAQALVAATRGDEAARDHLARYRDRTQEPDLWFARAAAAFAAAAAFRIGDPVTAAVVRDQLPADPDAVVLVGFGAAVLGPATLWTGLAARTLGDHDTARSELAAARALGARAGLTAWTDAVGRLSDPSRRTGLPLALG